LGVKERHFFLVDGFPYRAIADLVIQQPNGRIRLDSLNARLLALISRRANEWEPGVTAEARARTQATERRALDDSFASFESYGHEAPSILAHAWINTPDSTYAPTPRAHQLDDGVVRVIAFGSLDAPFTAALDRIQRSVPANVQMLLVAETTGHPDGEQSGFELLSPADEVAWRRTYAEEHRHLRYPIALWAGAKQPQEPAVGPIARLSPGEGVSDTLVVGDGHFGIHATVPTTVVMGYQRYLPTPSPVPSSYRLLMRQCDVMIVGGQGRVLGYQYLRTRADEAALLRRLVRLAGTSSDTGQDPAA